MHTMVEDSMDSLDFVHPARRRNIDMMIKDSLNTNCSSRLLPSPLLVGPGEVFPLAVDIAIIKAQFNWVVII